MNFTFCSPTFIVEKLRITCPPPNTFASNRSRRAPRFIISLISSSIA